MSAVSGLLSPVIDRSSTPKIEWAFLRGTLWSLSGSVASQTLSLSAGLLVARTLGREIFGAFGLIQGAIGMFGVFAGMGLGVTATKYIAEYRNTDRAKTGRILALVLVTSLLVAGTVSLSVLVFSPLIAVHIAHRPDLAGAFRIAAVMLFLTTINGMQTGALAGFGEFRSIATSNTARGICLVALVIPACRSWHLAGAIWTMTAGILVSVIVSQIYLFKACARAQVQFFSKPCRQEARLLWAFSIPAFLSGIFVAPVDWATNALLVRQPNGYAEMGFVAAAAQWRSAITFFPNTLGQPLLYHLSTLHSKNAATRYFHLVYSATGAVTAVCALLVAALFFLETKLLALYGPTFHAAGPVFRITVIAACLNAIASIAGQVIASSGRMWLGLGLNSVWGIALLIAAFILIPRSRAIGLAEANVVAYALTILLACLFVLRIRRDFRHKFGQRTFL